MDTENKNPVQGTKSICAIIPTYNRAVLLRECIDSILAVSVEICEIIVVNDGSTDDTERVVQSYGDRITLITKENGGKAAALNVALARCTSDYVWICDDDDLAAPDGLVSLKAALDADDTLDFAFGRYKSFRDDDPEREFKDTGNYNFDEEPNIKIRFLETMFASLNTMLVRRSAYTKAGHFREYMIRAQDYDMAVRLSRNARSLYVPQVIFFIRIHGGIRGSTADRFAISASVQKQWEYDRKIFAWVRGEFTLEEFTPTFALEWDSMLRKRATLLQRAMVCAKWGMWDFAIADFHEAGRTASDLATPQELQLAARVGAYIIEWNLVDNDNNSAAWITGFRACYRGNRYCRTLIRAACRPLVWRARSMLKKGDIAKGMQTLKMLVSIAGICGASLRILSSLFS